MLQNKIIKHGKVREEMYHRMFIPFTVPCREPILFNAFDVRLFCDAKEMFFIPFDADRSGFVYMKLPKNCEGIERNSKTATFA